jgi:hypothetical protein
MAGISGIDPLTKRRTWPVAIAVAILATFAATMLRLAVTPLIGDYALPVTIFFLAVPAHHPGESPGRIRRRDAAHSTG